MKAYSTDLRQRVIAARDARDGTRPQIAERFSVSESWVRKILGQRRDTGSIEPKPHGGGRTPAFDAEAGRRLREAVRADDDATLEELAGAAGVACSEAAVFRALARLGITREKVAAGGRARPRRPEGRAGPLARGVRRGRPGPAGLRRREWREHGDGSDPRPRPQRRAVGTSGGSLVFSGGNWSWGGTTQITGDGVAIQGTTVSIDGTDSGTNLELDSGTITGAGSMTIGNFDWVGGAMSGTGEFTVTVTSSFPGNVERDVVGWTFVTAGSVDIATTSLTQVESDGAWDNSGVFTWEGPGSITINGGSFENSGSMTLLGSGTLTVNGSTLSNGTTWSNSGTLILEGSGAISLDDVTWSNSGTETRTGSDPIALSGSSWTNAGTLNWQGSGSLGIANESEIRNLATGSLNIGDDQAVVDDESTPTGLFESDGTMTVEGAAGTMIVNITWIDDGSVAVDAGTLEFLGQGTGTGPSFDVAAGTTLAFQGVSADLVGPVSFEGDGVTLIDGADVSIGGVATASNLRVESGSIGAVTLTVADLTWDGGTIGGIAVDVSGPLLVDGAATLNSSTFEIDGAASVVGTGSILSLSGTIEVDGSLTFADFTSQGTGTSLVNDGTLDWASSGVFLDEKSVIDNEGTINLTGMGLFQLGEDQAGTGVATLENDARVNWSGAGVIEIDGDGEFWNRSGATFEETGDGTLSVGFGTGSDSVVTAGTFENDGTFDKTGGSGTTDVESLFTTSGLVEIDSGTLDLGGTATGEIYVASGANFHIGGYFGLEAGSVIEGQGLTSVVSIGYLSIDAPVTVSNLELDSGEITGGGDLTIDRSFTWTGGDLLGTGIVDIDRNATLDLAGWSDFDIGLRTINNEGTNISSQPAGVFVTTDNTFDDLAAYLGPELSAIASAAAAQIGANAIPLLGPPAGAAYLDDPDQVMNLFLNPSVPINLVSWDVPSLDLDVPYEEAAYVAPLVYVDMKFDLSVQTGLRVNFNTTGFSTGDPLDGFTVTGTLTDADGNPAAVLIGLTGQVSCGIGIPDAINIQVNGGLNGNIWLGFNGEDSTFGRRIESVSPGPRATDGT